MSLLERIARMEEAEDGLAVLSLLPSVPSWVVAAEAMDDQALNRLISNLLAAMPPPADPALRALWDTLVFGDVAALGDEEYERLYEWVIAGDAVP